ncbi:MAG: hypothetical protein ACJ72A_16455, partial [Nocardioidaceae bacterium]
PRHGAPRDHRLGVGRRPADRERRDPGPRDPNDEIRDAARRVPNLWFGDADEHEVPGQRFHIEV